jgi:hypothetical protein
MVHALLAGECTATEMPVELPQVLRTSGIRIERPASDVFLTGRRPDLQHGGNTMS